MKYDIFISYRRDGGYETAKHIADLLLRDGYRVSFDIDTLRNGNFDQQLYGRIDQCRDFIIVLNKTAFERTLDPSFPKENDWMRSELSYALKHNKNIIPIMLPEFEFSDNLPSDIAQVRIKNGPSYVIEYFDMFYARLREFLTSRPRRLTVVKYILSGLLSVAVILCGLYYLVENANFGSLPLDATHTPGELYNLGNNYFLGEGGVSKDYDEAFELYQKASEQGLAAAQSQLGYCYKYGLGVSKNYKDAVKWYRKSADQGDMHAQRNIGNSYFCGQGVPIDYNEAARWYRKSAEQGFAEAQNNLGGCYKDGKGVSKDINEAIKWFQKAADQGNVMAQTNLDTLK